MKRIISIAIIAIIIFYMGSTFAHNFNFNHPSKSETECKIVYHNASARNIVVRVDDIQAYAWIDSQERIIDDAEKRGVPLVLGVIPYITETHHFDEDLRIYNLVEKNKCDMEIAMHGYTHKGNSGEFSNLSFIEADAKIKKGLELLNSLGIKIYTFIPPNNNISKEAEAAVYSNGIRIISSGYEEGDYGFSTSTYDSEKGVLENYQTNLEECRDTLDANRTCVIMVHPQNYLTNGKLDEAKYKQYLYLLDGIKNLNATIVNFRDLYYKDSIRL